MTIRIKTILLLSCATAILTTAMIFTAKTVLLQGYRDLEQEFAQRNLKRAVNVLAAAQEKLFATTGDYSSWDDTYEFILNPGDQAYRQENFVATSFANINVNGMLLFNAAGTLAAQAYSTGIDEGIDSVPQAIVDALRSRQGVLPQTESVKGRYGIIQVDSKPVMFAARPILTNEYKGPARGTLIAFRTIDSIEVGKLSSIMTLPITIVSPAEVPQSPDSALLKAFIASGLRQRAVAVNSATLYSCVWIPDADGINSFILSYFSTREIFQAGVRASMYGIGWLILIVLVFSLIIFLLIERGVLSRFSYLRLAIATIKKNPDPSKRLPISGRDEVKDLTIDINLMLAAIEQAQQRAEKSEQQYHLLFEQMLNGFALFEAIRNTQGSVDDYRFLDVNPAFVRLTGLPGEQCRGKTLLGMLPDIGPQWKEHLSKVRESGSSQPFEAFSSSLRKHFEAMAFKATDERCGITFTDITNRKKAEEERMKAREDLAQAQKMQAVGQLAGGIAHDFNNQLATILGYAELLQAKMTGNPKFATYADRVIAGISRAADLTSQLLAFAHKGKNINRPVNMHSIILEVAELLERSIDKRIRITLQLKAPSAVVLGDPTQLQNVILNMGLNARDAMPEGGELTFATDVRTVDEPFRTRHSTTVAPGSYVMVSITDTGTGIDAETLKHLFEPFFTTKPRGKGTGMGLAASFGSISEHNGAICVYSEPGKGATFNVYLPLCAETAENSTPAKAAPALPGTPRILIVDDEVLVSEMADELLTTAGCTVRICSNGREAIDLYRTSFNEFDLVLLDMIMPEMNGTETFKQLKAINPAVKVIISSGFSMNNEAQQVLNLGAVSFIQKPYTRNTIIEAVASATTGK
jgi:signal transduction histidine kinase